MSDRPTPPRGAQPWPPTPNPEGMPAGYTQDDLWRDLEALKRVVRNMRHGEIIETLNQHDDRLDTHEEALADLKLAYQRSEAATLAVKSVVDEINKTVSEIADQKKSTSRQLELVLTKLEALR